jgi:two-component system, NarL family, sensor histidine kinase BarA
MEEKFLEILIYIRDNNFRNIYLNNKEIFAGRHNINFVYETDAAVELLNSKTFDLIITEFDHEDNFIYDILIYKLPVILIIDPERENVLLPSIFNQVSEIVSKDKYRNYIKLLPYYIDKIYHEKFLNVHKSGVKDNSEILNKNFLAVISHELRTPLNSILGFATLLIDEERDSRKKEKLKIIQDSGKYLANLINDILDLSKIENGKLKIENINFLLINSLKHIENIFTVPAAEKKIDFKINIAPSVPNIIFSDELRINQILINILTNAFKFTPENGRITVECLFDDGSDGKPSMLKITVTDTGIGIPKERIKDIFEPFEQGDESISKKYGGSGLGLSITKKILDIMHGGIQVASEINKGAAFIIDIPVQVLKTNIQKEPEIAQIDPSDSEKMIYGWINSLDDKKLESILLDAIKKLPEKMAALENSIREQNKDDMRFFIHKLKGFSGSFRMDEIYGKSCQMYEEIKKESFSIEELNKYFAEIQGIVKSIPEYYFKKQDVFIPANNKKIKQYNENAKILVAEDSTDSQKLIRAILEKVNIKCNFADNGRTALEMLRKQKYEILLLDMYMPVMDGIETIKNIREDAELKGLFVIALTADNEQSNRLKLLDSGYDDCLFKPVEKFELISKIISRLN